MLQRLRNLLTTKGDLAAPPQALLDALGVSWSTSSISPEVALRSPPVSAAVRAISEATGSLQLSVYRVGADGAREEARDHPVNALLSGQWNGWCGAYDGVVAATVDALCHDAGCLVWVNRVDGVPRELIRYRPGSFSVDRDLATDEPTFRLTTVTTGNGILPAADVINVRAFGAAGRAPLTLAREAIGLSLLLEQHAAKLFQRGARPGGVLRFKRKLDDATYARLQKSWSSNHSGEAAGRTAILEEDGDFTPLTFNSVDMQFQEIRAFQVLEIARAFRVSPHLLFELGRVTHANIENLGREFLVFTLQPMLRAWESALNRALLTEDERQEYTIAFCEDDLTQASLADRAVAYSSLISSRVINPNDARRWEQLPPYQGGDEFANPNVTPGPAPAQPEPPKKPRAVA